MITLPKATAILDWFKRRRIDRQQQQAATQSIPRERSKEDDSFDTTGFMFGMATGLPISPTHGISMGAMMGSMLNSSSSDSRVIDDTNRSVSTPSLSSDSSSDNSSSSSSDSSSSWSSDSSGGFDSGSSSSFSSD